MTKRHTLIVVTPISHIKGLTDKLAATFEILEYPDPIFEDIRDVLKTPLALFTNPNKSKLPINRELMLAAPNLKVIATASTGLVHIDMKEARNRGIEVLSLTREYSTIERISSTAELALGLTLAALRNISTANSDVLNGNWDYEKFIGRQCDALTIGVVGFGRLGKKYARYVEALGATVLVCDPAYEPSRCGYPLLALDELVQQADVISLHIHATAENYRLINKELLSKAKPNLLLVNTSRGELVDEVELVEFLQRNPLAKVATDVVSNELSDKWESPIVRMARANVGSSILITPHIGGMTREAQEIAYHRTADMLIEWAKLFGFSSD